MQLKLDLELGSPAVSVEEARGELIRLMAEAMVAVVRREATREEGDHDEHTSEDRP